MYYFFSHTYYVYKMYESVHYYSTTVGWAAIP
jgi:hypothetical protein